MSFLHPSWLWLLFAVPLVWFLPRRLADVRHGVLRTLVLSFLVLGMAQPIAVGEDAEPHVAFVVSSPAALGAALRMGRALESAHTVLIGPHVAPGLDEAVPLNIGLAAGQERPGSSLDRCLRVAARVIPAGAPGAVVVFGDGQSQQQGYGPALEALSARGIPVHTVRVPSSGESVGIARVAPRDALRVGRSARFDIDIVGSAAGVSVELAAGGRTLAHSAPVDLAGRRTVSLRFEPEQAGFLELDVHVRGLPAEEAATAHASVVFPVQAGVRALYLGQRMVEGGNQLSDLLGRGIQLEQRAVAGVDPKDALEGIDLVVLDDRPADTVPDALQQEIVSAVRDRGLGLVVSGGRAAFGAGGWSKSPVAALLPVEFLHREEKRDPSTALVVIIDTSGSMGGGRVQLAKEVARLAIRRLLPHDKVGIVEFYGAKRWAAPLQPASNSIEIERALNRLNAGGGTVILPAIEEAFYGLQNVQARYKHVLVLTDGGVERGSFEPLIRKMAAKGMNVSTVLIGRQAHSEFLVNIANWGKGRFYGVPNRFNLPEVILKQPASARLPAYRPGHYEVDLHGGPRWWGEAAPETLPPLRGYVETRTRPGAETLIDVTRGRRPVLSTWRYGLGRVTAFMTEPVGPGTEAWRDWKDYGAFLARVLARTASDLRTPYRFRLRPLGDRWQLLARRLVPGAPAPEASRVNVDERVLEPVTLRRRSDDLYTALLPAGVREPFVLAGAVGDTGTPPVRVAADPNQLDNGALIDPERGLDLDALAAATGGRAIGLADAAGFTPSVGSGAQPLSIRRLWPWLLLLALLCYILDVFHRRRERAIPEVS